MARSVKCCLKRRSPNQFLLATSLTASRQRSDGESRIMIERLAELESFKASGAASPGQISDLESAVGGPLHPLYKQFLEKYGSAIWFGGALFGIGSGPFPDFAELDALKSTHAERKQRSRSGFPLLPEEGCVIEKYAGGGVYWLFPEDSFRSGEVVLFEDDQMGIEVEKWPSFEAFLKYRLRNYAGK